MSPGAESANRNQSRPASPAVSPSASDTSQGAIWLVGSVGELASAGGWTGRCREGACSIPTPCEPGRGLGEDSHRPQMGVGICPRGCLTQAVTPSANVSSY